MLHTMFPEYQLTGSGTGLGSSVGRVAAPRSGGTGFDPGPRHTEFVNNGTSWSPLEEDWQPF